MHHVLPSVSCRSLRVAFFSASVAATIHAASYTSLFPMFIHSSIHPCILSLSLFIILVCRCDGLCRIERLAVRLFIVAFAAFSCSHLCESVFPFLHRLAAAFVSMLVIVHSVMQCTSQTLVCQSDTNASNTFIHSLIHSQRGSSSDMR